MARVKMAVEICAQAEQERRRILQRLKERREAGSAPYKPLWFSFHPEVPLLRGSCIYGHLAAPAVMRACLYVLSAALLPC